ncbi:MAG: RNA methyltransferase [Bacteroidota bacterium]|nr:RNA methyltransferase [Bacteroidota bacterium]
MKFQATHTISSAANPKFKFLLSLEKSKFRKEQQMAMVEGEKEIEMAIAAQVKFHSVYFLSDLASPNLLKQIQQASPQAEFIEINDALFSKISYRESTGGIIACVYSKQHTLKNLNLPENSLVLIVEGVEKPGNLGAILRTADACGIDAVIACQLPTDLYNPNIIRSSLGTVFTVPIAIGTNTETQEWLKTHGFKTLCTNLHEASDYHQSDYKGNIAIVVGTEATGVSEDWIKFADQNIKIPMLGKIDSMNVSVAAAIVLYEAKRQRGF